MEEVKDLLKAEMLSLTNSLSCDDDTYGDRLNDLQQLTSIYEKLEKLDYYEKSEDRKFQEEIRRSQQELDYKDILERDKLKMEYDDKEKDRQLRSELEREKMSMERDLRTDEIVTREKTAEADRNESRRSGLRDAGVRIVSTLIPAGAYIVLLALGMKLEFAEHGAIASYTTKELFRSLKPKV